MTMPEKLIMVCGQDLVPPSPLGRERAPSMKMGGALT